MRATTPPLGAPERPARFDGQSIMLGVFLLLLAASVPVRPLIARLPQADALEAWATVFVAVCLQALPFLALGVVLSGLLATFVTPAVLARVTPRRTGLAVPAAGLAGMALPGCECGSVPVAGGLIAAGAPPAAGLTFLLSAPAINPVVLVATAVAFPGEPRMVLARLVASLLVAVSMGWLWQKFGREAWLRVPRRHAPEGAARRKVFEATVRHDFLQAGGFLVLGGLTAATLSAVVPRSVLETVASEAVLAILALGLLAVVLALCSEADAFVAASLTQFSLTARLTFLVVGPAVDVKLVALQAGTFGRAFAMRFAPVTFVVAVATASMVGAVLL